MVGVATNVGVKQPNLESPVGQVSETWGQILPDIPLGIAYPVYRGTLGVFGEHRLSGYLRPEAHTTVRQVQPGLPAVQWVVVAVADERTYAGLVQRLNPSTNFS